MKRFLFSLALSLAVAGSMKTTDIGHHHVEQHKVRLFGLGLFNTHIAAISSTHLILFVRQQYFEQQYITHHIIDDKYFIITFNDS